MDKYSSSNSSKENNLGHRNASKYSVGILSGIGLFLLYFFRLGSSPLMDPDEPVYGEVAKEMASGFGWISPHYGGHLWFDKPPLFYWLTGFCAKILGPTELAVRLPSALLAVVLVFLVYSLAKFYSGHKAGIFSAIVMATCLQQIILGRSAVTDMTLAVCLTGALYCYSRWTVSERSSYGWGSLCGLMVALGMLTKGPVAPLLIAATIFIHLAVTHRLNRLIHLDALAAVLVFLAAGLPWYLAMLHLHRDTFIQGFLMANNVTRFLKPEHSQQTGHWYSYFLNIPILFAFFFPWSFFLPQAISRSFTAKDETRLMFIWLAVVFIFFSASKTLLVTYIFPLYPAAAFLVGRFLAQNLVKDSGIGKGIRAGLWLNVFFALLFAAALSSTAIKKIPDAKLAAIYLSLIMLVTCLAALVYQIIRKPQGSCKTVLILAIGMALFSAWLGGFAILKAGPYYSTKNICGIINKIPEKTVFEYNNDMPSVRFYLKNPPLIIHSSSRIKQLLAGDVPVFVICSQKDFPKIATQKSILVNQSGKQMLVSNIESIPAKGTK